MGQRLYRAKTMKQHMDWKTNILKQYMKKKIYLQSYSQVKIITNLLWLLENQFRVVEVKRIIHKVPRLKHLLCIHKKSFVLACYIA